MVTFEVESMIRREFTHMQMPHRAFVYTREGVYDAAERNNSYMPNDYWGIRTPCMGLCDGYCDPK